MKIRGSDHSRTDTVVVVGSRGALAHAGVGGSEAAGAGDEADVGRVVGIFITDPDAFFSVAESTDGAVVDAGASVVELASGAGLGLDALAVFGLEARFADDAER